MCVFEDYPPLANSDIASHIARLTDPSDINFGPDRRGHKSLERRCVATGDPKPPSEMVRFVLSPDGVVTPDIRGKLPGRGVWVSADRGSLETAIKKNGFTRGFKGKVDVPDDLAAQVEAGLSRNLLGLLAMARKSGQIYLGFDQVQSAARGEALAWRIEALDGSDDGRSKLRTLSKAVARELELPVPKLIGSFTAAELGEAMGRDAITHAAIPRGKLAKKLAESAFRLSGFVALIPENWPDRAHELPKEGL